MRNISALAVFLLCMTSMRAQVSVYHPMPDSNATWCESATWGLCGATDRFLMWIEGDTTIGTEQYHKLYASGSVFCNQQGSYYTDDYRGAFREDTSLRKVYFVEEYQSTEELLYDFTLGVGDSVPMLWMGPVAPITSVDSVLVGSSYRKRMWLDWYCFGWTQCCIVEGVGSNFGFYNMYFQGVESGSTMYAFTDDDVALFQQDPNYQCPMIMEAPDVQPENAELTVSPNPSAGLFSVAFTCDQAQDVMVQLTDVTGRVISTKEQRDASSFSLEIGDATLAEGVYFVRIITADVVVTKKVLVQR